MNIILIISITRYLSSVQLNHAVLVTEKGYDFMALIDVHFLAVASNLMASQKQQQHSIKQKLGRSRLNGVIKQLRILLKTHYDNLNVGF